MLIFEYNYTCEVIVCIQIWKKKEENVLEKYGRNIIEDVRKGKIDPVIGRDEEIRSITRILSRKTKIIQY